MSGTDCPSTEEIVLLFTDFLLNYLQILLLCSLFMKQCHEDLCWFGQDEIGKIKKE